MKLRNAYPLLVGIAGSLLVAGPVAAQGTALELLPDDLTAQREFGRSVSQDGDTVLIGATGDVPSPGGGGLSPGYAYVFERDRRGTPSYVQDDRWVQTARLAAPDGLPQDRFGFRVALSGDVALVGARDDDDSGSSSGTAFVFLRSDEGTPWNRFDDDWVFVQKLVAGDSAAGDNFGHYLAAHRGTLLVGARLDDDGGSNSGSAYVFERHDGGTPLLALDDFWIETAKLRAGIPGTADEFGVCVALSDDVAMVGADQFISHGAGAVYVFARDDRGTPLDRLDDVWVETQTLRASDAATDRRFGIAIRIDGRTALVGAPGPDAFFPETGTVYVFGRRDPGTPGDPLDDVWVEGQKLVSSGGQTDDSFGLSVDLDGEWALVSAYRDDQLAQEAGRVYVFRRDDRGTAFPGDDRWRERGVLRCRGPRTRDLFGWAVSVEGATAMVGARNRDAGADDSGAVYVYELARPRLPGLGGTSALEIP